MTWFWIFEVVVMWRRQRENGPHLYRSSRHGGPCHPLGNLAMEPASHWAHRAVDQPGPSCPHHPWGGASPCIGKLQWLCRAGSEQECLEGGKKAGERKQPHCHPPNYWLGWQGRRRKADIVYLIKSKQQFAAAAASLPLAVCRALCTSWGLSFQFCGA